MKAEKKLMIIENNLCNPLTFKVILLNCYFLVITIVNVVLFIGQFPSTFLLLCVSFISQFPSMFVFIVSVNGGLSLYNWSIFSVVAVLPLIYTM